MTDDVADSTDVKPEDASAEPTSTEQEEAGTTADESFFDPNEVPEELKPAYKQMQGAFTKKMQGLSSDAEKVQRYNEFMSNPHETLKSIAQQLGYQLSQPTAASPEATQEWTPNTWQEVLDKAEQVTVEKVLTQLAPVFAELKTVRRASIETMLDENVPEWREHEDEMRQALNEHPTLANDPVKLAKIVLPDSVFESKAMQKAIKKLQAKEESSKVSVGSSTRREPGSPALGKGTPSFDEAVQIAKAKLAKQGQHFG